MTTAPEQFAHLPLAAIVASLTNPRKTFAADKMAELASSIKASGVHQPILVRPLPASRLADTFAHRQPGQPLPTHEIVAGECRLRASHLAGVATIPAMVRDMTDAQALEAQIVENSQRNDLSPLEEAEGFETFLKVSGMTQKDFAEKIGKSTAYICQKLSLTHLSEDSKTTIREHNLDASRCRLIALVRDPGQQAKALIEATRKNAPGDIPSVRALQWWIANNILLNLDAAPFDITDSHLLAAAGSCTHCPKRTGANPDLFAGATSADTDQCTDAPCFQTKTTAHRLQTKASAAARGLRFIDGDDAKKICSQYSTRICDYSAVNQERQDVAPGMQVATLGTLLGNNKKDNVERVLIENPWTLALTEAVKTHEAEALLIERGLIIGTAPSSAEQAKYLQYELDRLKNSAEKSQEKATRQALFEAIRTAIQATPNNTASTLISPTFLRAYMLQQIGEQDSDNYANALGIDIDSDPRAGGEEETLRLHIQAVDSAALYKAQAILMMQADRIFYGSDTPGACTLFDAMATQLGVNTTAIREHCKATFGTDIKALIKAKTAELKALKNPPLAAKKSPTPNAPAAQASDNARPILKPGVAGTLTSTGIVPGAARPLAPASGAPLRKRKTTAAEAADAIATALQAIADAEPKTAEAQTPSPEAITDAADASPNIDAASGFALSVGMRVVVRATEADLPLTKHKWIGKCGYITRIDPQGASTPAGVTITFRGQHGGVCFFSNETRLAPAPLKQ